MSSTSHILFEQQGRIGRLTLNRPEKKNAQTLQMWADLRTLGQRLLAEPGELAVIIVSGAGGVFSSGIDTSIFTSGALLQGGVDGVAIQEAFSWLRLAPFVSIAAMEKYALGAGLELALWCDMRIAVEGTVMALPELEFGIIPDLGGCALLPEIVGFGRAMELIASTRRIETAEAHRWGLLNDVVPADRLTGRVDELATLLSKRSLTALRGARRAALAALHETNTAMTVSREAVAECLNEMARHMKR